MPGQADQDRTPAGDRFDIVVLGAGSGGYACALRAAQLGMSVALVEEDAVGGTCLHRGCIPTKAILHSAEIADAVRDAGLFGVRAQLESIDLAAVNAYKDGVVNRLYNGLMGLIKGRSITLVEGRGQLRSAGIVEVGGRSIEGTHIVLASGSFAKSLPGLDIDGVRVLTSDHALRLESIPSRVAILGGGVIGVEFASAWRSFGAAVTIVEALPRLLASEDEATSAAVQRAFAKRGIAVVTGTRFEAVATTSDGVSLRVEGGRQYDADLLLVAVGRGPRTSGLGYEEAGIALANGFVVTDERLATSVRGVYAVGDLVAGPQLAHRGFAHGIFVAEEIAGLAPASVADAGIPRVTYATPEVASVGLTEAAARDAFGDVETVTYDLAGNGKSQILKTQGFVKLVRRTDGPVVGIHMVGARVGELVAEAQLIYNWQAYPSDVATLIHMHPTQGEALGEAHLALAGKPLHSHS